MTKFLKSFTLFIFLGAALASCAVTSDTDVEIPADAVTTYTGILTYSSASGVTTENQTGTATITESGTTYTISFSDNVPSITDLKFQESNGSYATVSTSGSLSGININGDNIEIAASKDGENWAFSGSK